jgi:non-homologous end joining protein Ku
LQRVIDAKVAGEEIVAAPVEAPARVNLMEALKESLNAVNTSKKKRAMASVATPAKRKSA